MAALEHQPIPLCDPDITQAELRAVVETLHQANLSAGTMVSTFEEHFARHLGRGHAIAFASANLAMLALGKALHLGPGCEVVLPALSWHQVGHAFSWLGASCVFADIEYWSGTLAPPKAQAACTPRTKVLMAGNTLGHPADWPALREVAGQHDLFLLEDSTEALGSVLQGTMVGCFGDAALFDLSTPQAITTGEGAMLVTDDTALAHALRQERHIPVTARRSVVASGTAPLQATMSEMQGALGIAQLQRVEAILARRAAVVSWYWEALQSFEGIKDPFCAPGVDELHRPMYGVHLGTRFTGSAVAQITEDLRGAGIEAVLYPPAMHRQRLYLGAGEEVARLPKTDQIAPRLVVLPLHTHMTEEDVSFIVGTLKDATVNVGAGAAIY